MWMVETRYSLGQTLMVCSGDLSVPSCSFDELPKSEMFEREWNFSLVPQQLKFRCSVVTLLEVNKINSSLPKPMSTSFFFKSESNNL